MPNDLEQSIFQTLCWFSVSDRPVTGFEIWKWLLEPSRSFTLAEIYHALSSSEWLKERVLTDRGFYSLVAMGDDVLDYSTQNHIERAIATRQDRYIDAIRKFHKLKNAALFFQLFESVRAVTAVNSIAWWNTDTSSDIDLFIVVKPNAIWSTRLWMVMPFALFGIRPHVSEVIDPFCFSFFATSESLAMNALRLKEGDHYFAFWTKSMVPLFDRNDQMKTFVEANTWADALLPNAKQRRVHYLHRSRRVPAIVRHTGLFESFYKSIQQKRFPQSIQELANKDSRVVITDDMLKFHDNDRRAEFERNYQDRVNNIGV